MLVRLDQIYIFKTEMVPLNWGPKTSDTRGEAVKNTTMAIIKVIVKVSTVS